MLSPMALPSVSWMLLSCLVLLSQVQAHPSPSTQAEDSQKALPSPRISCPKGSAAYASHCYALFTTPKSWFDADMACQKRPSGHLVSVLNGAEGSFVSSLVKNLVNSYSYIWIGFHDPTQGYEPNGGGWEWSSGDLLNYLAWERDPTTVSNPGYCATLSRSAGFLRWKDYNCDSKLPYVCKFKS
ncbi:regenerating islet-derived protein 3-gamma [Tupaia chinensis]|uniref:Regenerating islet-derived protein 3-gamma n=1 Tax=Tupaia chinensis TaxID=246437 RepID=L8Y2G5_TUPCH|nr:regenerating islet-derived protein 3-gamma [Tupaia chinensis]ELV10452.1 Regenerating islet-derived protein 3-gamma [Tupaia chinensis]